MNLFPDFTEYLSKDKLTTFVSGHRIRRTWVTLLRFASCLVVGRRRPMNPIVFAMRRPVTTLMLVVALLLWRLARKSRCAWTSYFLP